MNKKIKEKPIKKKKTKKSINTVNVLAIIVSIIAILGLIGAATGLFIMTDMLKTKPELKVSDFNNSESSIVYDQDGNVVAELGLTIRENISYDDLPSSLIDAFVAVEDSRFFEHNGFDVPRFTKAILSNIRTRSFAQGGSTFTMQLVKNTYFSNDQTGQEASRDGVSGVTRKVQEIALAMELEKNNEINKKAILELYLNKLNFGGSRNIRGVQKAAEYYFDKDVSELNLAESALLAGVVNAPNAYNPFNNLDLATQRRNEVLYLMNYHGYISDTEYELTKAIKVEDLLVDLTKKHNTSNHNGSPYQAYLDEVIAEVYELTGQDPYTTGMKIYTAMNKDIQANIDAMQAGNYEGISFPDDEFEFASIAINNQTGEIVGILGGRNYAGGGSLLLNHATDQKKQPGSSIKPILDYVLAFENLGWSTSHVLVDKPIVYPGTNYVISNSSGVYNGEVTLKTALGNSLNTPAIQTLQAVIDKKGSEYVVDYLNKMGIDIALEDFDVQCGIGGNKLEISCLQLAGAQAALINGGNYIKPHTIRRIEFLNGKAPITPTYAPVQTVSEEAAYQITTLLNSNVSGGFANLMQILIDNYPVYAKTGTTDWGNSGVSYGIPVGAIKDAWMVGSSSEYTVATWIGYERAQKDKPSYIQLSDYLGNIQGKTTNAILDMTVKAYGTPHKLTKPDGLVNITHILGTYPYAATIEGMDEKYVATGLIKKEYATLVNPKSASVESVPSDPTIAYDKATAKLTINWPKYPDEEKLKVAEENIDISLKRSDGSVVLPCEGKRLFDYSWVYGPIRYKAEIKVNGNVVNTVTSETESNTYDLIASPGDEITVCIFYAYENLDISSSQKYTSVKVIDEEVTYTIPVDSDPNVIVNYLRKIGAQAEIIEKIADATHSAGTIEITCNDVPYTIGSSYRNKESELRAMNFKITCYSAPAVKISLTSGAITEGKVTVSAANSTGAITWSASASNSGALSFENNGTSIVIDVSALGADEVITVSARDDFDTATTTISMS
ncbi:MAG: transglycosylase domain-containing protein [Erysipelotrichaceae bacterium]|nr:transglycosylase domain-containing protein [Erysipelotrichaceae bacterium]